MLSKIEYKEFFSEYESMAENPAFINDFIDICWVDPWSKDPSKPNIKSKKKKKGKKHAAPPKSLSKSKKKEKEKEEKEDKKEATKNLNAVDDILEHLESITISNFQFPSQVLIF